MVMFVSLPLPMSPWPCHPAQPLLAVHQPVVVKLAHCAVAVATLSLPLLPLPVVATLSLPLLPLPVVVPVALPLPMGTRCVTPASQAPVGRPPARGGAGHGGAYAPADRGRVFPARGGGGRV